MSTFHASTHLSKASWRKSRRSASNTHCVEVAVTTGAVGIRDTKDRDGGTLVFTPTQWTSFTASLKQR
ncbi:DUF397 domain-containing protein [Saccharopolyspora phatthalungensis]|uniref:DUF397 domain-containing protein n=1 Tax=Saccharopolyspora phatthalungensis TaxID=664693 RepID=A0A840QBH4_9PSEU|nr:DUF397 domain-containing protein [Saccharopolyspora phatthalungensis]MBB5154203.1 hypothetical protein [Saccharopolyspora phatthalungensis]